jgi:hypothetical protein
MVGRDPDRERGPRIQYYMLSPRCRREFFLPSLFHRVGSSHSCSAPYR